METILGCNDGFNLLQLAQTWSNLFSLGKTCSDLLKLVQTCSNLFRLAQTYSGLLRPAQTCLDLLKIVFRTGTILDFFLYSDTYKVTTLGLLYPRWFHKFMRIKAEYLGKTAAFISLCLALVLHYSFALFTRGTQDEVFSIAKTVSRLGMLETLCQGAWKNRCYLRFYHGIVQSRTEVCQFLMKDSLAYLMDDYKEEQTVTRWRQ